MCQQKKICIYCDNDMLHCYECDDCYCETVTFDGIKCPGNSGHEWLTCGIPRPRVKGDTTITHLTTKDVDKIPAMHFQLQNAMPCFQRSSLKEMVEKQLEDVRI